MTRLDRATAEGILFTDQYQLTMAQLYFRLGLHERTAQFDHYFRRYPDYGTHQAGYCINAGLEWFLDWLKDARFGPTELEHLRQHRGQTGEPIFGEDFLQWLSQQEPYQALTIEAIPEGRVVHPNTPLTIVRGPAALVQIIETPLLNQLNYQTLIATKAARIKQAGRGQLVLEFGMRRGHERGVNAGTRAALIGGADFSSNAGISHVLGYPPKGTHAHSMVQLFLALGYSELDAFRAYADLYPDDCLLLVDTVDTLQSGVPNAIRVFEELHGRGHKPIGIRLDSGDLAHLAVRTAALLDKAGFPDTSIVLSNELDEIHILQILNQIRDEAPQYNVDVNHLIRRLVYGVGTRLITSEGSSALGGVFKLVAIQDDHHSWRPAIKISESAAKTPNPGYKKVWRVYDRRGLATADLVGLHDEEESITNADTLTLHHPIEAGLQRTLTHNQISKIEPLLKKVLDQGHLSDDPPPSLEKLRQRRESDLEQLDFGVRRLINPHIYHVSLTSKLSALKEQLIEEMRHP